MIKIYIKNFDKLIMHHYKSKLENNTYYAITKGKFNINSSIFVRVLSTQIKKNILKNKKIFQSLKLLNKYRNFLLLIINKKDNSDNSNINTLRYYGIGAQIIKDLKVKNMILISRSKKKIIGLEGFGLKIKKQIIIK